jgi:Ferritin-like
MLRFTAADGATPPHIVRDFQDPYLELVRLVREASEIEHALLVQYLYASFSVKPRYQAVIGTGGRRQHQPCGRCRAGDAPPGPG